jgi:hypothetical protein
MPLLITSIVPLHAHSFATLTHVALIAFPPTRVPPARWTLGLGCVSCEQFLNHSSEKGESK